MKQISIEKLQNDINNNQKGIYSIKLEGIISTEIQIQNLKIQEEKDIIILKNGERQEKYIKINKHQIMKIEENKEEYIIKFDSMQNIKIKEIKEE